MKLLGKYPVDTRTNIKTASAYFEDHYKKFRLSDRIEYATGLAPLLDSIGEQAGEKVAHYANPVVRDNYIEKSIRPRNYLTGGLLEDELTEIVKVAAVASPEDFMVLLADFDHQNNITHCYGHRLTDPYDSVFMSEKVAMELSGEESWQSSTGDVLKKSKFQNWAQGHDVKSQLFDKFGSELSEALISAQGWDVFSSLPDPHKQVITRMVNENVINGTVSPGLSRFSVAGNEQEEALYEDASTRIEKLLRR